MHAIECSRLSCLAGKAEELLSRAGADALAPANRGGSGAAGGSGTASSPGNYLATATVHLAAASVTGLPSKTAANKLKLAYVDAQAARRVAQRANLFCEVVESSLSGRQAAVSAPERAAQVQALLDTFMNACKQFMTVRGGVQ
jgi:hypothetical protein